MTEENKIEVKEVKTCFCQSEWFKKFLTKTQFCLNFYLKIVLIYRGTKYLCDLELPNKVVLFCLTKKKIF